MATAKDQIIPLASHLTQDAIFDRYRQSLGAEERTYWQIIYLKSLGKVVADIAQITGNRQDWVRRLVTRYNELGPDNFVTELPPTLASREQHADYARKTRELDTARVAQQSLLSVPVPTHKDLEIDAFMRTATEVGGDYYDFNVDQRGTLTLAIGDATGHGAKAGMMVTATKTLFNALSDVPDLLSLVRTLTRTLKSLNLRGTYMHLSLGRYHQGMLDLVVAGMPPALLYRSRSDQVSAVVLKGMPLGSFPNFPYERCTLEIRPGDAILLVSDGLTELVNPAGEMLTHERVRDLFHESARGSAHHIIHTIQQAGRAWRAEQPLQDDVTMVVLKRKTP